ncbi:MAG: PfkB family carbohydrate kinase [Nitrososphaerales archaeon]
MRICILGHLTIDSIRTSSGESETTSLGGPPCYAGIMARVLRNDVDLVTKFGMDLPDEYTQWMLRNELEFGEGSMSRKKPTTRFIIENTPVQIQVLSLCEGISSQQVDSVSGDILLVSPVLSEIGLRLLSKATRKFSRCYLDPQGFLRNPDKKGICSMKTPNSKIFSVADIVKVDLNEGQFLTGRNNPIDIADTLSKKGPSTVLVTMEDQGVLLSTRGKKFMIPGRKVDVRDTTGVGDILAGAYLAELNRTGEDLRSACMGVASAYLSLGIIGLSKIPKREEVESLALELQNSTIRVRTS